jgi:hypothetical protein
MKRFGCYCSVCNFGGNNVQSSVGRCKILFISGFSIYRTVVEPPLFHTYYQHVYTSSSYVKYVLYNII